MLPLHSSLIISHCFSCKIKSTYSSELQSACVLKNRPSVAVLQLKYLCLFGASLVTSSWCWASVPTYKTWIRFFRKRILGQEIVDDEICTKPKHKIIADAYAKRHQSFISVSLENSHTDPVNVMYTVNNPVGSVASDTWTKLMPHLLNRRCAVTLDPSTACDSEISVSVRQYDISVESRRNSADSQVSVKMSETEFKMKKKNRRTNKQKKSTCRRSNQRRPAVTSMNFEKMKSQFYSNDDSESNDLHNTANVLAPIGYTPSNVSVPQQKSLQAILNMMNNANGGGHHNSPWRQCGQIIDNGMGDDSSLSSSIEPDIGNAMHSSFSAHSIGGNGKTHSRNSKASCDVGIQANAMEIAAHTRSYDDGMTMDQFGERKLNNAHNDDDEPTEMHQLLPNKEKTMIVPRNDARDPKMDAKLQELLLPSKY